MIPFDARIIVATNQNLRGLVQVKKFREDLYYRLNVLELNLPVLRQRSEDIYPLFRSFMEELNPKVMKKLFPFHTELENLFCSYSWPGNVRELENFVKMLNATIEIDNTGQEIFLTTNEILNMRLQCHHPQDNFGKK